MTTKIYLSEAKEMAEILCNTLRKNNILSIEDLARAKSYTFSAGEGDLVCISGQKSAYFVSYHRIQKKSPIHIEALLDEKKIIIYVKCHEKIKDYKSVKNSCKDNYGNYFQFKMLKTTDFMRAINELEWLSWEEEKEIR